MHGAGRVKKTQMSNFHIVTAQITTLQYGFQFNVMTLPKNCRCQNMALIFIKISLLVL